MGDRSYRVVHPTAAEALIDEADFEHDERLPYWADLWPSATALARRLAREEDLSGARAVELGCGVGLPTVVALARGAQILATDHYRAALDFTRYNAHLNLGEGWGVETRLLDWHAPGVEGLRGRFDLVLAADVLYERRNALALAKLIPELLAPGGEALIADPRRREAMAFLEAIRGRGFLVSTEESVVESGGREVGVLTHRLAEGRLAGGGSGASGSPGPSTG